MDKKEVQQTITPSARAQIKKATEEEFSNILRLIAPGTNIRTAINGIQKAGKGAIIVVENEMIPELIEGGFRLNALFTPQRLIELSKMDGALILSEDMKRIVSANVLLTPDHKFPSNETGTRHKAAERTAKQAGTITIAVSERRNEITVYYKNIKHHVLDSNDLLRKANESLQHLEKQRELFDQVIEKLNFLEIKSYPSLNQATQVIQKGKLVLKIASDMQKHIIELGKEGDLVKTRLKEIVSDVEKETEMVIKDYSKMGLKKARAILNGLSYEDLSEKENILRALFYEKGESAGKISGWRILSKALLSEPEIALLIGGFGNLENILIQDMDVFKNFLGEEKAKTIKNELDRIKSSSN